MCTQKKQEKLDCFICSFICSTFKEPIRTKKYYYHFLITWQQEHWECFTYAEKLYYVWKKYSYLCTNGFLRLIGKKCKKSIRLPNCTKHYHCIFTSAGFGIITFYDNIYWNLKFWKYDCPTPLTIYKSVEDLSFLIDLTSNNDIIIH